jgi:hypothetical protein
MQTIPRHWHVGNDALFNLESSAKIAGSIGGRKSTSRGGDLIINSRDAGAEKRQDCGGKLHGSLGWVDGLDFAFRSKADEENDRFLSGAKSFAEKIFVDQLRHVTYVDDTASYIYSSCIRVFN